MCRLAPRKFVSLRQLSLYLYLSSKSCAELDSVTGRLIDHLRGSAAIIVLRPYRNDRAIDCRHPGSDFIEKCEHSRMTPRVIDVDKRSAAIQWPHSTDRKVVGPTEPLVI